ncbi:hypothetical protein M9Y10_015929 [Tritrichomonas musculus]|uniref:ubiquitinyl hydrolase 1 n=1 Tax=Tritrichomonas musculus TaxID=1915356 RepID=A0ABR2I4Y2_9EUKA
MMKKSQVKKNFKQNLEQITDVKATYLPQKVALVNKDFYDEFIKWLSKRGKSPKNLNTLKLLNNGKLKSNLKRGIDFEIINTNFWHDITEKFGSMHKIELILVKNPTNGQEIFIPPNGNYIKFNIYLPVRRAGTSSYSQSSMPIQYYSASDWLLKEVKNKICYSYNHESSNFSFARHLSTNPDEQISENFKMGVVAQSYSRDLDLKHTKSMSESRTLPLSMRPIKKLSTGTTTTSSSSILNNDHFDSRPNTNRMSKTVKPSSRSSVQSKTTTKDFEGINGRTDIEIFPKPVGLNNLGNTCFFNAAVQCLVRVMPLTTFVLSNRFQSQLNPSNSKSSRGNIARSYRRFLEDLCNGSSTAARDPSLLRRAVVSKYPRFANYGQHDSQELLCSLLDGLHEDMNQSSHCGGHDRPISVTSQSDSWQVHISRNSSPIVDIFHGILYSSVTCPSCGHVEEVHDPFIFLSLPLQRKLSAIKLEDCLNRFSQREVLDAKNKYRCEKCKKMVCAMKEMGIEKCGKKVLIIHFKRFSGEGQFASKIDTPVDYPDVLDVGKFAKDDRGRFRLIGAVFHSGGLGGGHYTAAAIDPASNSWYYFNDSMASKISKERAHSRGAYILFYQRLE